MSVFLAPHSDDETLFGSFTLLREKPLVVVCFDRSFDEPGRMQETWSAMRILGCEAIGWGTQMNIPAEIKSMRGEKVFAPAYEQNGHAEHNLIADLCARHLDPDDVTYYLTYTQTGPYLKRSEGDVRVPIKDSSWVLKKLQALACYTSQICSPPNYPSYVPFLESQWEWYAA